MNHIQLKVKWNDQQDNIKLDQDTSVGSLMDIISKLTNIPADELHVYSYSNNFDFSRENDSLASIGLTTGSMLQVDRKPLSEENGSPRSPGNQREATPTPVSGPQGNPKASSSGRDEKSYSPEKTATGNDQGESDNELSASTAQIKATSVTNNDTGRPFALNMWMKWALLAASLAILGGVVRRYYINYDSEPKQKPRCEHFSELQYTYRNTDEMLWSTLTIGVDRAINKDPGEPSTFILLHNSSNEVQRLLDDVTRTALNCFGSGGAIWRSSNDFQTAEIAQDYGVVLDRYRDELKLHGVLVVQDLDRVPPKAAKVFFPICDAYEPLVRRAVILFTIDISRQPQQVLQSERSATSIAEDILKDLWRKELHPNELDPLVVRLTENVFRID